MLYIGVYGGYLPSSDFTRMLIDCEGSLEKGISRGIYTLRGQRPRRIIAFGMPEVSPLRKQKNSKPYTNHGCVETNVPRLHQV